MVGFRNLEIKVAETEEEREKCYRLRYDVFAQHGFIDRNRYPDGRVTDEYDDISVIFYASRRNDGGKEEIVGTIRVTPPTEKGFQIEELFDVSKWKQEYGDSLWESSKVVVKNPGKEGFGALLGLAGAVYRFLRENDLRAIVYMTGVWNEPMYRKLGVIRAYPEIKKHPNGQPTVALLWDVGNVPEKYVERFERIPMKIPVLVNTVCFFSSL